jgi:cellulose synthase/poly-beta-1,6-N-acetylglucosamine synthase-like glycosyltransferase
MLETTELQAQPKPKLFIATPMYGGMCVGGYTMGILECVQTFMQHGIQMYYSYMMNESLITRARNGMAYDFLQSDATHLMFIDADITFKPQDIVRMVQADKDIICGLYPKKEINWKLVADAVKQGVDYKDLSNYTGSFVVNLVGGATESTGDINHPMEIDNGGTGFMLIKRDVFLKLQPTVPKYTNDMILIVDKNPVKKIIDEFFATSIDETSNRLLSEDYHFCKIAREAGFKVYAAPWANLTHSGTYNFSGTLPRG